MKIRSLILSAALVLTATSTAVANPYGYYPSGPRYAPQPNYQTSNPVALLENALERLQTFFKSARQHSPEEIYQFVDTQIAPYFNFDGMTAWIARPYYKRMPAQQRAALTNKIKETFLKTLGRELGIFTSPQPQVDFYRPQRTGPNTIEVTARVLPGNGYPIRLNFRFRQGENGWKVVDVSSNGISAVQYYRQQFLQMARQYAGSGPATYR